VSDQKTPEATGSAAGAPAAAVENKPVPGAAPAPSAGTSAPKPAAPPSLTPLEMIPAELKQFLQEKLASGDPVTIEARKESFTGRIFRLTLEEGWIALEHEDGRRRAMYVIEGGRISDGRREMPLGGAGAAGHAS
jgi:hypothetical protein